MTRREYQPSVARLDDLQPRSLGDILAFLRDLPVNPEKVRPEDIAFAFNAMFGCPWGDPETEQLRRAFLNTVGADSARHLCKYVLSHHPGSHFSDGFTDDDLGVLLDRLVIVVVMVLQHEDLDPDDSPLQLGIRDGQLCARASTSPSSSRSLH